MYAEFELSVDSVETFAGMVQFLCQGVEDHVTLQQAMQGQQQAELQRLVQASGKMVLLDKLLPKLRAEGHKVAHPPALTWQAMTLCPALMQWSQVMAVTTAWTCLGDQR